MSGRAEQALADAQALGLSGFSPRQMDPTPHSSAQPPAPLEGARGRAAMQVASRAGISGFAGEPAADQPVSARCSAILALAGQIGLAGFGRRDNACNVATRDGAEEAVATAIRLRLPGFSDQAKPTNTSTTIRSVTPGPTVPRQAPSLQAPQGAKPSKPVTRQPFAVITIAPGGSAAFTSLETKMGQPFAAPIAGQSSWLQRDSADGTQTRAYPVTGRELAALRDLAGPLGGASVQLSVGGIVRGDFGVRSSNGALPAGARPSGSYVDAGVPAALRKALGR